MREYIVYTDGASRGFKPGAKRMGVAYAVIMQELNSGETVVVKEVSGIIPGGTNNRSELFGPLIAIDEILEKDKGKKRITIYTDSKYVVDNFRYLFAKFFSFDKKYVYTDYPNSDLWIIMGHRKMENKIEIKWVSSKIGNLYNVHCDSMCDAIYKGELKPTYQLK